MSYKLTIKASGVLYSSESDTVESAFLAASTGLIRASVAIVTVEHEGKKQERVFGRLLLSQLLSKSDIVRSVAIKNLTARYSI
jgi:hypothetical protein